MSMCSNITYDHQVTSVLPRSSLLVTIESSKEVLFIPLPKSIWDGGRWEHVLQKSVENTSDLSGWKVGTVWPAAVTNPNVPP
jgi:hypothetical protein